MSTWIIMVFILEFFLLACFALLEKNYGMMLYGIGGAVLNYGILLMGK